MCALLVKYPHAYQELSSTLCMCAHPLTPPCTHKHTLCQRAHPAASPNTSTPGLLTHTSTPFLYMYRQACMVCITYVEWVRCAHTPVCTKADVSYTHTVTLVLQSKSGLHTQNRLCQYSGYSYRKYTHGGASHTHMQECHTDNVSHTHGVHLSHTHRPGCHIHRGVSHTCSSHTCCSQTCTRGAGCALS